MNVLIVEFFMFMMWFNFVCGEFIFDVKKFNKGVGLFFLIKMLVGVVGICGIVFWIVFCFEGECVLFVLVMFEGVIE